MNSQELRALQEAYNQVYELDEASYSAKSARAGKDIGKPGKQFAKIAASAAERYGSEERGKKVAGAVLAKLRKEETDLHDIILSHLLDEGYADTQEQAEVIMVNMSEEWRESIVEVKLDPRGRPASGPMNVYANPKGKPSQAHLDAVKSYDAEQKKKTPEQRKAEQDAYRERQMNNK